VLFHYIEPVWFVASKTGQQL